MADVQRENGHLDIANELAEAFARHKFSTDEWRILWVVIRKTYGWQKKADMISLSQFATMTGMKAAHCCRALSRLVSRNVITRSGNTHSGNTHSGNTVREYAIQKDFDAWSQITTTCSGNTQTGNQVLPKQVDTNTNITNEVNQTSAKPKRVVSRKVYPEDFETFWKTYPPKTTGSKSKAALCWEQRILEGDTAEQMIEAAKSYAEICAADKTPEKFIKMAQTFIGPDRPFADVPKSMADEEAAKLASYTPEQRERLKQLEGLVD